MRAMALSLIRSTCFFLAFISCGLAADTAAVPSIVSPIPEPPNYYWAETAVGNGAELITLFGRFGSNSNGTAEAGTPLLAVLRDSLDSGPRDVQDPSDDRLRYVWLLTSDKPTFAQRVLSAVPFFYWKLGRDEPRSDSSGDKARTSHPAMLVDLSQPEHRVWRTAERNIIQWTAFDPMAMPVRASSRAYRTNSGDQERVHLEGGDCVTAPRAG